MGEFRLGARPFAVISEVPLSISAQLRSGPAHAAGWWAFGGGSAGRSNSWATVIIIIGTGY